MWKRKCKYNNKNKYRIPVFEKRPEKWELEISFLHIQINVEYISQYCLLVVARFLALVTTMVTKVDHGN